MSKGIRKVTICPTESLQDERFVKYIGSVIRNAMEDFHCKYLSDSQMKELNPIIRNAIYTAFVAAIESSRGNMAAKEYVSFALDCVPPCWENPELLDDYLDMVDTERRKKREAEIKKRWEEGNSHKVREIR